MGSGDSRSQIFDGDGTDSTEGVGRWLSLVDQGGLGAFLSFCDSAERWLADEQVLGGSDKLQTSHTKQGWTAPIGSSGGTRLQRLHPPGGPRCTGMTLSKFGVRAPPKLDGFSDGADEAQIFERYNGNSWGTLKKRLERTTALVLFAQEVGFSDENEGARAASGKAMGWNMLCSSSESRPGGQHPAGVAIFARTGIWVRMAR